ncbi:MAG TPA: cyclophane-forming radical SAM/SPASM peptide maturase GrrM/OscB [Bacteroidia bacterium]|nr:cyclophane-forming radical SAM/SPASM peptide maturase GrrM/OscB [Bacteroidia bacterium]
MADKEMKYPAGPVDLLIVQGSPFCNIDCKYCYLPDRLNKTKIRVETVLKAVQRIVDEKLINKQFSLVWHAGEPLAVPVSFYKEVVEGIKKIIPEDKKVVHHIQSNGMLLDQEWCDFIKAEGIRIGLSCDGPEFIHDRNRLTRSGKGTFKKVMEGMQMLKDNGIDFHVIGVITDFSLDHAEEIYNFFQGIGVRSLGLNIDEEDGANKKSTIQAPLEDKLKKFWAKLYDLQINSKNYLHIRELFNLHSRLFEGPMQLPEMYFTQMNGPLQIIALDINGNFTTFSPELLGMKDSTYGYENFDLGNVHDIGFLESLDTPKFKHIFNEITKGIYACRKECEYFNLCGGGAPSNKLYENQSFATTETRYCRYTRKIIIDAVIDKMQKELAH